MRVSTTLLVLLFSVCGALETQSTKTGTQSAVDTAATEPADGGTAAAIVEASTQLEVSAELKELRDMVLELRVALRFTQDELKVTQGELKVTQAELTAVNSRLVASEAEVSTLKQLTSEQNADLMQHEVELKATTERLTSTEIDMEDVKTDVAMLMELFENDADVQEKNLMLGNESGLDSDSDAVVVDKLRADMLNKPRVAFSAALFESYGEIHAEFNDMDLVYSQIFTNIGQAYSESTGFFTAPVKGVYYFRFTGVYYANGYGIGLMMYKNDEKVMYLYDYKRDGRFAYLSSGLPIQLEAGDTVHMRLQGASRIYDDEDNHSTFSGFLIFPL